MKYIVWGVGKRLEKNIERVQMEEVVCFADKRADSYADGYNGKKVISPDRISEYEYDAVAISSNKYRTEIARELIFKLGVSPDRIIRLDDILTDNSDFVEKRRVEDLRSLLIRFDREDYVREFQNAGCHYFNSDQFIAKLTIDQTSRYKIYTVSYKEYCEIDSPLYSTVWVGDAIRSGFNGIRDNEGENISNYNSIINECTALFWIWKNDKESDYIGLNHYRRFFSSPVDIGWLLQEKELRVIMKGCDVVVCKAVILDKCIPDKMRDQICEDAFDAGYRAIKSVFDGKSAKEREAFERFIQGNVLYPRQMFVMRRELLNEYCSWLFPILFEMIKRVEIKDSWDAYSKRVIGFWAERMLTVWLLYTGYRIEELPVIMTDDGVPYGMDSSGT